MCEREKMWEAYRGVRGEVGEIRINYKKVTNVMKEI